MSKLGEGALRTLIAQLVRYNVIREDFRLLIDTAMTNSTEMSGSTSAIMSRCVFATSST